MNRRQLSRSLRIGLPFGLGVAALSMFSTSLFSGVQDGIVPDDLMTLPPVGSEGGPVRPLNPAEEAQWLAGLQVFDHDFHRSDGLGAPEMNADSCRACHQVPAIGGAGGLELNVSRFGNDNGGAGPFVDLTGGQGLSKLYPPFIPGREEHDPLQADVYEQRQTPSLFGVGLIGSIFDLEILANEDPLDLDGDGIVGVARMIPVGGGMTEIGRYGWKAQIPDIEDFIRDAMGQECGITTPDDGRGFALLSDGDLVADPELAQTDIDDLAFFLRNLAEPQRSQPTEPLVLQGEMVFDSIGCAKCHVPSLNGTDGPVNLYSDLLLHDVWPASFRGMEETDAPAGVYRTAPLWGIARTAPYMHDGSAETIKDAILLHDGTAATVRMNFEALSLDDERALIAFLRDL